MRYAALDVNGDMIFGQGSADFLVDSPACVQQAILTGLKLWQGEWFLDTTAGMPWATQVLGFSSETAYDQAIKSQVLNTIGVTGISTYSSSLDTETRNLTVQINVETIFGPISISTVVPFGLPPTGGYGVGGYGAQGYGG